jgi:putative transposon-encoded protein
VGVDGGTVVVSGMDLAVVSELAEWAITTSVKTVVGFGGGEVGRTAEREVVEWLGVFLAVEDGDAVVHRGSPEAIMGSSVTDDVLADDIFAVMIQRGVEDVSGSDLVDVPRRHIGAGAEVVPGGDFAVGSEELTNSALILISRVVLTVGSIHAQPSIRLLIY